MLHNRDLLGFMGTGGEIFMLKDHDACLSYREAKHSVVIMILLMILTTGKTSSLCNSSSFYIERGEGGGALCMMGLTRNRVLMLFNDTYGLSKGIWHHA